MEEFRLVFSPLVWFLFGFATGVVLAALIRLYISVGKK